MTIARLHVVGSAHEARFDESFDIVLAAAIAAAQDPARAAIELDELGLLGVLAFYAAAGAYDPDNPEPGWWGLEADPGDRRYRRHHYTVQYSATHVDVYVFIGRAVSPGQTIVGEVVVDPQIHT